MTFSHTSRVLRQGLNQEAIEEALQSDLGEHFDRLPLLGFLEEGGWPSAPEFEVGRLERDGDGLSAEVVVYFTELVPACCSEGALSRDRKAELSVVVTRDGRAVVDPVGESLADS